MYIIYQMCFNSVQVDQLDFFFFPVMHLSHCFWEQSVQFYIEIMIVWNDFFLLAKLTRQKISVLGTKKNSWQIKIQLSKCSISKTEHQLNESKRRHLSIFVDFLCRTGMKVFKTSRQLHLQTSKERLVVQNQIQKFLLHAAGWNQAQYISVVLPRYHDRLSSPVTSFFFFFCFFSVKLLSLVKMRIMLHGDLININIELWGQKFITVTVFSFTVWLSPVSSSQRSAVTCCKYKI